MQGETFGADGDVDHPEGVPRGAGHHDRRRHHRHRPEHPRRAGARPARPSPATDKDLPWSKVPALVTTAVARTTRSPRESWDDPYADLRAGSATRSRCTTSPSGTSGCCRASRTCRRRSATRRRSRRSRASASAAFNTSKGVPPNLLTLDPPRHDQLRKLVSRVFTARTVSDLEPRVPRGHPPAARRARGRRPLRPHGPRRRAPDDRDRRAARDPARGQADVPRVGRVASSPSTPRSSPAPRAAASRIFELFAYLQAVIDERAARAPRRPRERAARRGGRRRAPVARGGARLHARAAGGRVRDHEEPPGQRRLAARPAPGRSGPASWPTRR